MWTIRHARDETIVNDRKVNSFKLHAAVFLNRIHPSLSISDITTYLHRVDFYHSLYHSLVLSFSLFSLTIFLCFFSYTHEFVCLSFHSLFPSRTLTLFNFSPCLSQYVRLAGSISYFIFLSAKALYLYGNQCNIKH